ncbi:hypothetical protein AD931_03530 [Gluconobacter oxydans]|uniref:Bacterial mobilisation domain-containing protein n=2 Tax=Gluconobacter oxydans TaxID=442 RepID=A0AB34XIV1_GLUOY|nr:plasmid mobilization relaxosome protein MobC [Gluconobacter oxydans]AHK71400.1 hypothetical protein GLS_c15120 [Gluconobacter oxydans DSM 3504]KXV09656.1 hypothetical protein AD931_03530 [Gluconobacter oxydans]
MPEIPSLSRTRSSRLSVRASPDELERWTQTARFLGHATTADWVRTLLQDAVLSHRYGGTVDIEIRKLRGELGRIGNNLNQLVHAAHLGKAVACGDTLQEIDCLKDRTDSLLRSLRSGRPRRLRSASVAVMH